MIRRRAAAGAVLFCGVLACGRTFVLMANNEMLSAPFRLGAGQLSSSPFAEEFFRAFVR